MIDGALDPWHVLVVNVRGSDTTEAVIKDRGFPVYNPRCRERARFVPMFPGYLFVKTSTPYWRPILSAPGVLERLRFGDVFAILTDKAIEMIRTFEAESLELRIGATVRITDGPLAGMQGPIGRFDKADRIEVLLRILGRQTTVRLPIRQVERVQSSACRA
jgi:transcription antitermination factor NusG